MSALAGTAVVFGWVACWMFFAARHLAGMSDAAWVGAAAKLLPAFMATTWLVAFAVVPDSHLTFRVIVLWAHHTSVSLLFLFLLAGQYFQLEIWWRVRRGGSGVSVAAAARRFWALSELVPAPVALTIFITGLRLIWESPEVNSLRQEWLLGIVAAFSAFFWDGILGYQPIVRRVRVRAEALATAPLTTSPATRPEQLQLLAHCVSLPFVFALGISRWSASSVTSTWIGWLEERLAFLPAGWPQVATALLIWMLVGATVWLVRGVSRSGQAARELPPLSSVAG